MSVPFHQTTRCHIQGDSNSHFVFMEFYIHGSVHCNSILIRSNKMQQYAGIYLLQNHSTCFVCPSHPSSGVHKTNCSLWYSNNLPPTWPDLAMLEEGCCSDTMTCTRGCSYSFIHSLMMGVMDTRNM